MFLKDVNFFKNQHLDKSEIGATGLQLQIGYNIKHFRKTKIDGKDKVINILREKWEKIRSWRNFLFSSYKNSLSYYSNFICSTSYLFNTQNDILRDDINMNQDHSTYNISAKQIMTQGVTKKST